MNYDEKIREKAPDVVEAFLFEGMKPEQAVLEVIPEGFLQGEDGGVDWQSVWYHPAVTSELSNYKGDELKEALGNRDAHNLLQMHILADETTDDRTEQKIRKFLAEVRGYTKTEEVKIEHSNRFRQMGPEELIEELEAMEGVSIDREAFVESVFS